MKLPKITTKLMRGLVEGMTIVVDPGKPISEDNPQLRGASDATSRASKLGYSITVKTVGIIDPNDMSSRKALLITRTA